jgi:hypothetical protein
MPSKYPTYSAAFVKKQQYYWAVLSPYTTLRRSSDDALAEGYESTKEDAWAAAKKAARALGIPVVKSYATDAGHFHYNHRGGKEAAAAKPKKPIPNPTGITRTGTFQGSPLIWAKSFSYDEETCERTPCWGQRQVVKVTNKYVFVFQGAWSSDARLDRAALERDGFIQGSGHWSSRETYFTEVGRQADLAKEAEKERQRQAEHAIWLEQKAKRDEETRLSLIGKECIFCGDTPDRYTEDKAPACSPCHKKARGWYHVPANMIVPFRTIDA